MDESTRTMLETERKMLHITIDLESYKNNQKGTVNIS